MPTPDVSAPPLAYTIPEVADMLGVHQRTVARWVADGSLLSVPLGRRIVRILPADLDAFLEGSRRGQRRRA